MCKTSLNLHGVSFRCRGLLWGLLIILIIMSAPASSVAQQPTPTPTLAPGEFVASKIENIVGIWESRFGGAVAYMQFEQRDYWYPWNGVV